MAGAPIKMAPKPEVIGAAALNKVPKDSRVDVAWLQAKNWMGKVKLNPPKVDLDAILKEMEKQKKPMDFIAEFDGQWLKISWRVGSKKEELTSALHADAKDPAKAKAALEALKANSSLVSADDLKKFEQANPDPAAVNKTKGEISALETDIKNLQGQLKDKLTSLAAKKKAYADMGGK